MIERENTSKDRERNERNQERRNLSTGDTGDTVLRMSLFIMSWVERTPKMWHLNSCNAILTYACINVYQKYTHTHTLHMPSHSFPRWNIYTYQLKHRIEYTKENKIKSRIVHAHMKLWSIICRKYSKSILKMHNPSIFPMIKCARGWKTLKKKQKDLTRWQSKTLLLLKIHFMALFIVIQWVFQAK